MSIISIIPARGGSKGVPKKNIREIMGKPLIAYTIIEALKSNLLQKIIVTTDDEEIAKVSKKYGAEIIREPQSFAKDESPVYDVVIYIIEKHLKNLEKDSIIILLQPTSPLRKAKDIKEAINLFLNNKCDSLISVCKSEHPPYWTMKVEDGFLKPFLGKDYFNKRRQDLKDTYIPNGAIFIASIDTLYKYNSFYCENTIPYIMPRERSIDIDNELDFFLAEAMMLRRIG